MKLQNLVYSKALGVPVNFTDIERDCERKVMEVTTTLPPPPSVWSQSDGNYLPTPRTKPVLKSDVYLPTPPRLLEPKWWQLPTYPKDPIEIETTQIPLRNR